MSFDTMLGQSTSTRSFPIMQNNPTRQLVLASTSPFRRSLLERLSIPFDTTSPAVDETALEGEAPRDLVMRLAELKARAGATGPVTTYPFH